MLGLGVGREGKERRGGPAGKEKACVGVGYRDTWIKFLSHRERPGLAKKEGEKDVCGSREIVHSGATWPILRRPLFLRILDFHSLLFINTPRVA